MNQIEKNVESVQFMFKFGLGVAILASSIIKLIAEDNAARFKRAWWQGQCFKPEENKKVDRPKIPR